MKIAKSRENLSCIELSYLLIERSLLREVMIQVTSLYVLHEKIDSGIVLEHIIQVHNEGMLTLKPQLSREVMSLQC